MKSKTKDRIEHLKLLLKECSEHIKYANRNELEFLEDCIKNFVFKDDIGRKFIAIHDIEDRIAWLKKEIGKEWK